jgi:phenylacetate-CoA ligase
VADVSSYAATVFYGFPGYLLRLGEAADGRLSPKRIFTSGEMLDGRTRKAIEAAFDAPVFDIYGCTEVKEIAWQCPERDGYHINSDLLLVESVDDNGQPVPAGIAGTILVTSLYNLGMPLLRYQVGDAGPLLPGVCRCGRGLPLMGPCQGRSVDYFILPNGTQISPYAMTCAVEPVDGVQQYQIVQEARRRVVLIVVPTHDFGEHTRSQLATALESVLPDVSVEVKLVESIPAGRSGKYRIVTSRLCDPEPKKNN